MFKTFQKLAPWDRYLLHRQQTQFFEGCHFMIGSVRVFSHNNTMLSSAWPHREVPTDRFTKDDHKWRKSAHVHSWRPTGSCFEPGCLCILVSMFVIAVTIKGWFLVVFKWIRIYFLNRSVLPRLPKDCLSSVGQKLLDRDSLYEPFNSTEVCNHLWHRFILQTVGNES